ncbi:2-oxoglutarate and iron-dependent oxygenase domain-containing protein [Sphingomonas sp. HITSZ_GF]|uniref:isopenicillin N synthase family dioxygenase n=1 Tax=Sphingomonas sp. HITSZ_GF TaxID=3037247 RepID=UPI00240DE214|nr:2-oxoglutarate and iron-dependent oxygenase domain-containing protein [Sphingomonas sp. HITSZ_GF]MDG2533048.1 2-oxoglutarate and iron-dependent oxygenase domain-containing protein [Sphingomonas sp. HITSZ_GF]
MAEAESAVATDIPVIDVAPLLGGSEAGIASVAAAIGQACRSVGFFYIAGHGVPAALLERVYAQSRHFFDQPQPAKSALSIAHSMNNRGYAGIDAESLDPSAPADFKEAYNLGRDPEPGEPIDPDLPSQGRNQWPEALPDFRGVMLEYYAAMRRLGEQLHAAFALDLDLPADYFAGSIDRPLATLRLLRYPPASPADERPGAGAHTDYGNLTILSQDGTGGLEVQTRDGRWLAATPIAGTFVCNIGDCLMRWSNDIYKSTPHRVSNHSPRQRHSVAFFFDPNADALIDCLPTCRSAERPPLYTPILAGEYLRQRLDATYGFRGGGIGAGLDAEEKAAQ